jgi:hypothetical protein
LPSSCSETPFDSLSLGINKLRSDVHFSKVLRVSSPSQIALDQMSISQKSSRHFLQLDEMDNARKNQFLSSGIDEEDILYISVYSYLREV